MYLKIVLKSIKVVFERENIDIDKNIKNELKKLKNKSLKKK